MCKHIHLVCRCKKIMEENTVNKKANEPIKISDEEVKIEIELATSTDGNCMEVEQTEIVEEKDKDEIVILGKLITAQRNNETFNRLKERVKKNVLQLLAEVQSCTLFDKDALQHALKDVTAAKHKLIASKENRNMKVLESKIKASNDNITTQRHFYSTKKKAKERKIRLAKPSIEEK